jgi:O-antigen/teichoic acid export membrane protein
MAPRLLLLAGFAPIGGWRSALAAGGVESLRASVETTMTRARATMGWLIPYAASVALTKGVALITIPLLTGHLPPADFARLELVSTIVEIAGLGLSFCAADLMHRFVGAGGAQARANAAALTGALVVLALCAALLFGGGALALRPMFGGVIDADLLAVGLFAASISSLIEAPLAWLRCEGRARLFLIAAAVRAFAQTSLMAATLSHGHGAFGVMAGNAAVDACMAILLVGAQARATGLRLDARILREALAYGWPLLAGGLAMFALGNCDRFFLAAHLPPEALAHYALAGKLATIVALAMQPFGLWWNARRIAAYDAPDGPARSAQAITWGFALLCCGLVGVALCAPPLVWLLLPQAYAPAGALIPLLAVSVALNECCALANVSVYRDGRTRAALAINAAAACVAFAGYAALTPAYGVAGALAATWLGHGLRLAAFLAHGARHAPMPAPFGLFAAMAGVSALVLIAAQQGATRAPLEALAHAGALAGAACLALLLGALRADARAYAARPA